MHDFGEINLKGKHIIVKTMGFNFKPKISIKERTFVIEGGPGCDPDPARPRKLTGHWLSDKMKDNINSYDIEKVL